MNVDTPDQATESALPINSPRNWRKALRLIGGIGAMFWILLSWLVDTVTVSGLLTSGGTAAQITEAHTTALLNCVTALGLCVALYVLSTIGQ